MTGTPIKLMLDEHIWKGLTKALRERGYDAVSIVDINRSADDDPILELAASQGRAVLTFNVSDFSPMANLGCEVVRTTFTIILPLAVSLSLVQGFFYPGAHDVLWQIGPLALKREGLEFAFTTGTRLLLIAGAGLIVVYATHPADLALALVQA